MDTHGGQTSPNIRVCDTVPFRYTLIAKASASGVMDTADFLYTPLDVPKILNPIPDTVCASAADWRYQVDIPGGDFFSRTIPNQQRKTGVYEFWRHAAGSKVSTDTVTYVAPNGCKVSDIVHIYPIDAGADIKLCLGSPAVQISGGSPAGGYWTGPGIQPNGSFDLQQWVSLILCIQHPTVVKIPARFLSIPIQRSSILYPTQSVLPWLTGDTRSAFPAVIFIPLLSRQISVSQAFMNSGDCPPVTVCEAIQSPT
ncbi:MAG: hypothetical protein IPI30_09185 [Saprospiraceae bacterium]|nr:hypothetical protein [Candidatus Vicinibacter affinis]